jgi:undecaprenyl-diphosphatase
MSALHALIIGIVEGLTEFLPVSSTAHMILAQRAMGMADSEFLKSFDIIIQLGAILAVVALYWRKLLDIRLLTKLAIAFVPTGIIGLTVYKTIKEHLLGNVPVVLAALVLGGIVLIIFDRRPVAETETNFDEIDFKRAFAIGAFQAIAVVPGVSRSAATIVGGSLIGVGRRTIVEFSFLLAIPTMAAATLLDIIKSQSALAGNGVPLAIGFVTAFITAIVAIKFFLAIIRKHAFSVFGIYRIVLAIAFYLVFGR